MNIRRFKSILHEEATLRIPETIGKLQEPERHYRPQARPRRLWQLRHVLRLSLSALTLVVVAAVGMLFWYRPVATLTLDINPSFAIKINVFEHVVDMQALDGEGEAVLANLASTNGDLSHILATLFAEGVSEGFLAEAEAYLLIGISARNYEAEQKLAARVQSLQLAPTTTIRIVNRHTEASESIIYRYARMADAEIAANSQQPPVTTAVASPDFAQTTQQESPSGSYGFSFDSLTTIYASSVAGSLSEADFLLLASELEITEAKLQLVLEVFFFYPEYDDEEDLLALAEMSLRDLFALYETTLSD